MTTVPDNLPSIADAQFPGSYLAAKAALKKCLRVDECKAWADRAAAMATYAKIADDDELLKNATRIKGLATKRCGELLAQIAPNPGRRPAQEMRAGARPHSRKQAAKDAGLSPHDQKTALRVAAVPDAEFEAAINSDDPPTVTELAKRGTKKRVVIDVLHGRDPADFHAATQFLALFDKLAESLPALDQRAVARGLSDHERARLLVQLGLARNWLAALQQSLAQEEEGNEFFPTAPERD